MRTDIFFFALAATWLVFSFPARGQDAKTQCVTERVVIPLDSTGIGDWRYLNPRRPYPLIRREGFQTKPASPGCWTLTKLQEVEILFRNRTSDRVFNVEIPFQFEAPTPAILEALDRLQLNIAEVRLLTPGSSLVTSSQTSGLDQQLKVLRQELQAEEALAELKKEELEILKRHSAFDPLRERVPEIEAELLQRLERASVLRRQEERLIEMKKQLEAQPPAGGSDDQGIQAVERELAALLNLVPKEGSSRKEIAAAMAGLEDRLVALQEQLRKPEPVAPTYTYQHFEEARQRQEQLQSDGRTTQLQLLIYEEERQGMGTGASASQLDQKIVDEKARLKKINTELAQTAEELRAHEISLLQRALKTLPAEDRAVIEAEMLLSDDSQRIERLIRRLASVPGTAHAAVPKPLPAIEQAIKACRLALGPLREQKLPSLKDVKAARQICVSEEEDSIRSVVEILLKAAKDEDKNGERAEETHPGFRQTLPLLERFKLAFAGLDQLEGYVRRVADDGELRRRCKVGTKGELRCSRFLNISSNDVAYLGKDFVELLFSSGLTTFKVSFSDQAEIPSNAKGYLQTGPKLTEPTNQTTWNLSASTGYLREPELPGSQDGEDLNLTAAEPYDGEQKRRLPANANFKLSQTLGNRAEGLVTFAFKSGDLGESDQTRDVEVKDYQLRVFGENGSQLRFGKYKFISSIGANAAGEGFEWYWRGLSAGLIINRESLEGVANDDDLDARTAFFQLENIGFGHNSRFVDRFDFFALWGEDEKPDVENEFWTLGFKQYFALPNPSGESWSLAGDVEVTLSDRRRGASAIETLRNGRGTSVLLAARASDLVRRVDKDAALRLGDTRRSIGLMVGYGDGDEPGTEGKDEGFLGATAAFAPDKLFISRLAGELQDDEGRRFPGLSNKLYFGFSYEDKRFSPLSAVWALLNPREPLTSESTKISFHSYRWNEPVFGETDIGWELDIEFRVQAPKGATFSLGAGWFFADQGAQPFFPDEDPWILEGKVSLNL